MQVRFHAVAFDTEILYQKSHGGKDEHSHDNGFDDLYDGGLGAGCFFLTFGDLSLYVPNILLCFGSIQ